MNKVLYVVLLSAHLAVAMDNQIDFNSMSLGTAIASLPPEINHLILEYINPRDALVEVKQKYTFYLCNGPKVGSFGHILIAISPDSNYIVTAASTGELSTWDVSTGKELKHMHNINSGQSRSLVIHPDNKTFTLECHRWYASKNTVVVEEYDLFSLQLRITKGGKRNDTIPDLHKGVRAFLEWRKQFLHAETADYQMGDHGFKAVAQKDPVWPWHNLLLMDKSGKDYTTTQYEKLASRSHEKRVISKDPVIALCISPDERFIVTGSECGTVYVWDIHSYGGMKYKLKTLAHLHSYEDDKPGYARLRAYFLDRFDAMRTKGEKLAVDDQLQKAHDCKKYRGFLWNIYQRCFDEDAKKEMAPYIVKKKL